MLATLEGDLLLGLAHGALHSEHDLLGGLRLLIRENKK